jgi:hypothetical protein
MKNRLFFIFALFVLVAMCAAGQQKAASVKVQRTADGHPDLSGIWLFSIDLPPTALKRGANGGTVSVKGIDASGRRPPKAAPAGSLPSSEEPTYKPEYLSKVKDLFDRESKTDPVFYCGRPGVPRIGSPRRIIQSPKEMIFLYEDISGDPYRIIPTDGRPHRADGNPSYYGDSVGHWEGDTMVIDVTNFVDDTWFGEGGYFHSDAMHVTERMWRDGENLVWQAIVEDPKVLAKPWTMPARVVKPSNEPLEESPKCVEQDGKLLQNNDHHGQR